MDGFLNPEQFCPVSYETSSQLKDKLLSLIGYLIFSSGMCMQRKRPTVTNNKIFSYSARAVLYSQIGKTFSTSKLIAFLW